MLIRCCGWRKAGYIWICTDLRSASSTFYSLWRAGTSSINGCQDNLLIGGRFGRT